MYKYLGGDIWTLQKTGMGHMDDKVFVYGMILLFLPFWDWFAGLQLISNMASLERSHYIFLQASLGLAYMYIENWISSDVGEATSIDLKLVNIRTVYQLIDWSSPQRTCMHHYTFYTVLVLNDKWETLNWYGDLQMLNDRRSNID